MVDARNGSLIGLVSTVLTLNLDSVVVLCRTRLTDPGDAVQAYVLCML